MCMPITTERAIKNLKRYDTEFYTPENRMAHRMAVEALKEQEERNNPKPLTREELMEMGCEPVYVVNKYNGARFWDVLRSVTDYGVIINSFLIPCFGTSRGTVKWEEFEDSFTVYRYELNDD